MYIGSSNRQKADRMFCHCVLYKFLYFNEHVCHELMSLNNWIFSNCHSMKKGLQLEIRIPANFMVKCNAVWITEFVLNLQ